MTAPTLIERVLVLARHLDEMRWYSGAATCREAAQELARLESQLEAAVVRLAKPAEGETLFRAPWLVDTNGDVCGGVIRDGIDPASVTVMYPDAEGLLCGRYFGEP